MDDLQRADMAETVEIQKCTTTDVPLSVIDHSTQKHFLDYGYIVLTKFLDDKDLEAIERRVESQAPDQSLRSQYNQSSDSKRYEYSLTRSKPVDVLGKRKARDSDSCTTHGQFRIDKMTKAVRVLCPLLEPAESFCIVSESGSLDQPEHTDSIPNEDKQTPEEWQRILAYIGALTPLRDIDVAYGQTALLPGSHTNPLATEEIRLSLHRGDVLVMDGRTVHRGLANTTSDTTLPPRKMCFFTYTLPDFIDGNAAAYSHIAASNT